MTKSEACQDCTEFQRLPNGEMGCLLRPKASQEAVARGEILCGIRMPRRLMREVDKP